MVLLNNDDLKLKGHVTVHVYRAANRYWFLHADVENALTNAGHDLVRHRCIPTPVRAR